MRLRVAGEIQADIGIGVWGQFGIDCKGDSVMGSLSRENIAPSYI